MAQRLIQLTVHGTDRAELAAYCEPARIVAASRDAWSEDLLKVQMTVSTEDSEAVLDRLQQVFGSKPGFQVTVLPLEAVLPRPVEEVVKNEPEPTAPKRHRISREELYQEINAGLRVRSTFVTLVFLSSVVAAIGLYRNDIAILIGAMVIAPLLGPNIALSLAATLGDEQLARRALGANALGAGISLLVAVGVGAALGVEPDLPALLHRSQASAGDLVLALSSGIAGALAFTTGLPAALIGVMVAVALMPPLVAFGMLLGAGHLQASLGPLLLLATNVICLNLAAIGTFVAKGIRPRTWWEAEKAKNATRRAAAVWGALFAGLLAILWYLGRGGV